MASDIYIILSAIGYYYKVFLKISRNLFRPATLSKGTQRQVISCDFCKIFRNTYFVKHLQRVASERNWCKKSSTIFLQYKDIGEPCWKDIFLKSDPHIPKKIFVYFNENPLKMTRNVFYLILKALFILKIFKLLSWLFYHI